MIRKLRIKFIAILMSVVTVILLAVFAFMLISVSGNSKRLSSAILRQALLLPQSGERASYSTGLYPAERPGRMPILVASTDAVGEVTLLVQQLHFLDDAEAGVVVRRAMSTDAAQGTMSDYALRWLKADDGSKITFVDVSLEQNVLSDLIKNSLMVGAAALAAFFLISLPLSRWISLPVERAWERQRQFVANASHELKTPLTVILSNADMLGGCFSDEKAVRRLEHIQAEATSMKKLVGDMLELARSDSAEHEYVPERLDFSFLTTNTLLTFEPVIYDEGKELEYSVDAGLFVTGDAARLRQLIGILLDNAIKYSTARISVSLTAKTAVILKVENDGAPIAEDELNRVFERFYRADKARSADGSFGLGLSIARSIVSEHGGRIWAESGRDKGSCFIVTLERC